jgi:6-phosphogluconolactonase
VSVVRESGKDGRRRTEICASLDLVAARGAELFLEGARCAIDTRGRFTVALSGGSSPAPLFRRIAEHAPGSGIDWGAVHVLWADERCVPPDHPDSNFRMADELLLSRLPSPGPVVHRIAGELSPDEAALRYEDDLSRTFTDKEMPDFDMIFLGIGNDGHTASLFPGMDSKVQEGRKAVAVHMEKLKSRRVTLTLPVINNARHVVFLVTGADKAEIVAEILAGKDGGRYPAARVAPAEGILTWLLDAEAAGRLVYR